MDATQSRQSTRLRLRKLLFKIGYACLKPLPPPQFVNRLRGRFAGLFMKHSGRNLRIYNGVNITNPHNISIGNDVVINPGSYLVASEAELVIGDDCLIAPRCFLETMSHSYQDPDTPIRLQGRHTGDIRLGRDVWLGYGVVVLPSCTIGDGAIVGAYGLVTKDIEPFTISVGNPARVIGRRRPRSEAQDE